MDQVSERRMWRRRRPLCADKKTARMGFQVQTRYSFCSTSTVKWTAYSYWEGRCIPDIVQVSVRCLEVDTKQRGVYRDLRTVFIDLILSDRCSQKKTGTSLMNHVLALSKLTVYTVLWSYHSAVLLQRFSIQRHGGNVHEPSIGRSGKGKWCGTHGIQAFLLHVNSP